MPSALLEQALELAGNAIFIVSADGAIQQANSAALALSGYRLEQLRELKMEQLFTPAPVLGGSQAQVPASANGNTENGDGDGGPSDQLYHARPSLNIEHISAQPSLREKSG